MLKINKTLKTMIALASCFLITSMGYAATQDPLDDGPDPPPGAPIDDYLNPMLLIAVLIGVIYLARAMKHKHQNC